MADRPDLSDAPLLRAARGLPSSQVPVWFMRQAGRSLPEYRALRGEGSILDAIRNPELSAEITLQPVHRYGVDAAILYSDIVVPAAAIDFGVDVTPGIGPVVSEPFRTSADLDRLRPYEPDEDAPYVGETIDLLVKELGATPLIGFAGAPFTVASYLIEGRPSRTYGLTKAMMHGDTGLWRELLDRLADMAIASLLSQIEHGASAIQLFDSWAGSLSPDVYEDLVLPASTKVFDAVAATGVPRIHFGVGTGELLRPMAAAGADVVGVDWRIGLDEADRRLGHRYAVQGNLDPALLGAPWPVVAERTRAVIAAGASAPGHVFNLGHGVPPDTDPAVLQRIVDLVHEEGSDLRRAARRRRASPSGSRSDRPRVAARTSGSCGGHRSPASPIECSSSPVPTPKWMRGTSRSATEASTAAECGLTYVS